jgi:hypothetical protein
MTVCFIEIQKQQFNTNPFVYCPRPLCIVMLTKEASKLILECNGGAYCTCGCR